MPPEPSPSDRKDFFKERKYQNSNVERSSDSLLSATARWRDYSSPHQARWGSLDFRRPPGHGKQGGYSPFGEESSPGYVPSRSTDKMSEDESCRLSASRGRNTRVQRDWKGGNSWEMSNASSNCHTPGRLHDGSVDDMITHRAQPPTDFATTWDNIQCKDHHDNKIGASNGLAAGGQKCERETSLDWKPLKWARSTSLSSRGSGFSHSSSSKSFGGVDSGEAKPELQVKSSTPVQSPSGDVAACAQSAAPFEETTSRKKPRLGWGEGLAKYEKKKVDGPDVTGIKDGAVSSPSTTEPVQSLSSTMVEKSPRVTGFSDCASPATPSSVACSSSPGVEEKAFGKAVNVDNDSTNLCGSPSIGSQNHLEGFLFNLEKLDTSSMINLGPLVELFQSDDQALEDSSFVRSTAINKLLILKGDILKELEVNESEIDSLETELKSLKFALGSDHTCATVSSLSVERDEKHLKEHEIAPDLTARPAPLQIESFGDASMEKVPPGAGLAEGPAISKDEDIDSPGTATSKFVQPLSLVRVVSSPSDVRNECPGDLVEVQPANVEPRCSVPDSCAEEATGGPNCEKVGVHIEGVDGVPVCSDSNLRAGVENMLYEMILGSNKESGNSAREELNKVMPTGQQCYVDIPELTKLLRSKNDFGIRENIAKRKQFLRFKERVLTIKFKALRHLWNEDRRSPSVRKYPARSQKKCELSVRSVHGGYQKHRSSIRSRICSPGNLGLFPSAEVVDFSRKLLSDSQAKVYRSLLKMPAMILDENEKRMSRFQSSNGLVEDPLAAEKERSMINPWTLEEREIFLDKLAICGKDFRRIASYLDYKSTADCVEFYYKNHKSDCFQKMKKRDFSKQGKSSSTNTYMLTSGKKWNRKIDAASLDILGEASEMAAAAHADNSQHLFSGRVSSRGRYDSEVSLGDDGTAERSSSFDVYGSERETAAADVLAGICGSLSSEAMSSCITSSVDAGEGQREWKHQKLDSVVRRHSTSDITQNGDDDTCSDESCGEMDPVDWTDEEKSIFLDAFSTYGKDFAMISQCLGTRSRDQCKVFFSKLRKRLGLDPIHTGCGVSDEANGGGGSDTEDVCVLEISDADKCLKMDDVPPSGMNIDQFEFDPSQPINLQTDLNKKEEDDRVGPLADNNSAVKILVSEAQRKSEVVSEFLSDKDGGAIEQSDSVQPQISEVVSDTEHGGDQVTKLGVSTAASSVGEAVDPCPSSSIASVDTKKVVDLALANEAMQDSNTMGNSFTLSVDTTSCSGLGFDPESMRASLKLKHHEKTSVAPYQHESSLVTVTSVSQESGAAGNIQDRLSSTLDLEDTKVNSVRNAIGSNEYQPHPSENSLLNCVESSHILKGYPLHISNKEANGDVSSGQLSQVQSNLKSDRTVGGPCLSQDCYLQKCNSSVSHSSTAELPFLSQTRSDHSRTHSRGLSDSEKPCRNGDVKLFGKILSHPSSSPKPNASIHDVEEKGSHLHRLSGRVSNIKFAAQHQPTHVGGTTHLKFDRSNYLGLENVPVRSYGFWDGNRIQTGFSALPDSAILLAKYPAAFGNYPGSSAKMEQQTLHSVVNGNEHSLNSVAPRDINGSNGVMDYQVYRSREGSRVQPFTLDVKQRQELIFSEMQRRNGFEARSSLQQQQGRGMVGVNVVGRGGIIVGGGPCNGISDPVAAIKRHYAEQQNGSMMREEESWRSAKGDLGR